MSKEVIEAILVSLDRGLAFKRCVNGDDRPTSEIEPTQESVRKSSWSKLPRRVLPCNRLKRKV
ncbi:MAG: hypothetical protein A2152_02165 [Candidatus Levybacteria bacterium RBG_16_35_6]|nr:MAG: hypothetical protein A2152_02165 [Candidatus Levybacteria bacterium RBG_16_35_6]